MNLLQAILGKNQNLRIAFQAQVSSMLRKVSEFAFALLQGDFAVREVPV